MHDLVIKGGTLVDGTGASPTTADVAVDDGRITDVGRLDDDIRGERRAGEGLLHVVVGLHRGQ